mgnify:CR=1 FL=1
MEEIVAFIQIDGLDTLLFTGTIIAPFITLIAQVGVTVACRADIVIIEVYLPPI